MSKKTSSGDGSGSRASPRPGSSGFGSIRSKSSLPSSSPATWIRAWSRSRSRVRGFRSGTPVGRLEVGEQAARRHRRLLEPLRGRAGHARHEREVVIVPAPVHAGREPDTHPAMLDRVRIGRRRVRSAGPEDPLLVPPLGRAIERGEVVEPQGVRDRVARHDMDPLRAPALECRQPLGIDTDLEQGGALDGAGELRVGDLVVPVAEIRRAVGPQQEVGMAAPAPIEERRLVDDVDASSHGIDRLGLRRAKRLDGGQAVLRHLVDRSALGPEPFEVRLLVRVAALLQEHDLRVLPLVRLLPAALDPADLERRQVTAFQEADEIRGGDDQRPVDILHPTTLAAARDGLSVDDHRRPS